MTEIFTKLKDRNEKLISQRNGLVNEKKRLDMDMKQVLGAIGGFGASAALTQKVKNEDAKFLLAFAGTLLGAQVFKESDIERQNKARMIDEIDMKIKDINAEIEKNTALMVEKYLYQATLPKEIEVTETQEIKILKKKPAQTNIKQAEGVLTASQMVEMEFDLYILDGKMGKFFGNIAKNTFVTGYGKPGSGKSTFFIQAGAYMTKFGLVLYDAAEEGKGPTFQKKLKMLDTVPNDFHIYDFKTLSEIKKALSTYNYKFCFIDSINVIKDAIPEELDKLREQFPDVCFFIIMQCNKDGNYKGSSDYSHNSDVNIEVVKGVAKTLKTRFNEDICDYHIFKKDDTKVKE